MFLLLTVCSLRLPHKKPWQCRSPGSHVSEEMHVIRFMLGHVRHTFCHPRDARLLPCVTSGCGTSAVSWTQFICDLASGSTIVLSTGCKFAVGLHLSHISISFDNLIRNK